MSRIDSRAYRISVVSLMIALVAIFELVNRSLPMRAPWGMSIDFVALPVMLTFFILGTRYAFAVSIGMYFILMLFGFAGFVGATMKFFATIPMVIGLGLFGRRWAKRGSVLSSPLPVLVGASVFALLLRTGVALVLNYYWAVPLFLSMPIEEAISSHPMFGYSIWGFVWFVSSMNLVQGTIDIGLSWFIVRSRHMQFRLKRTT
ncbi:MAG: hypothetical protein QFX35_03100 [Candidatus Verstraetearchaeota archaeon]|nr:hypothetical protein [Candidatus Verstraetearchaeota archaeon]